MYTIEFQKCGQPHAHLLLFLHSNCKYSNADDIDWMISAKIPCPIPKLELYKCVKDYMIHGPCGLANKSLSCMKNGKCSQFYPKIFQNTTTIFEDGFPHYRRKDNSITIVKNHISLKKCSVVSYNFKLLLKFQTH